MQYLVNTDSKKNDLHINIDPLLDLVYRMIATSLKNGRFFFVWMHRWMDGWIDGSMDAAAAYGPGITLRVIDLR